MTTRHPTFLKTMKTVSEQPITDDLITTAHVVVLAKRELATAIEKQASAVVHTNALIASGTPEGSAKIRKERRWHERAIHNRKVALHRARQEFLEQLETLRKRFGCKHLSLDGLVRHCGRLGLVHDDRATLDRREALYRTALLEAPRDWWDGKIGVDDLQVFHDPRTGIQVTLHDFSISGKTGIFEIRLPNEAGADFPEVPRRDFRVGQQFGKEDQDVRTAFGLLLQFFHKGIAVPMEGQLLAFYGQHRRTIYSLESRERLHPTPEQFIQGLGIVTKYAKICGNLGKVLPICPGFELSDKKVWLGELESEQANEPRNSPRDDLAVALSAGLGLQLVRLRKADNSQANLLVPELADPKDYGAIEYTKFGTFHRAAK